MKRIIHMLSIMMLVSTGVYGQSADDPVIGIFNKYEEREGVESITISPALLGMMKDGKTSDRKTQDLLAKINGLRILTLKDGAEGKGRANRESLTAELQAVVKRDYEEIMKVRNPDDRLELYVRKNPENCKDCMGALLFITSATDTVSVIYLSGTIDKGVIESVMSGDISISNK